MREPHKSKMQNLWLRWRLFFILLLLNIVAVTTILILWSVETPRDYKRVYAWLFEPEKVRSWYVNCVLNNPYARRILPAYEKELEREGGIERLVKIIRTGAGDKPDSHAVLAIVALAEGPFQNATTVVELIQDSYINRMSNGRDNKFMASNWVFLRMKERLLEVASNWEEVSIDVLRDLIALVVKEEPLFAYSYDEIDPLRTLAFIILVAKWKKHILLPLLLKEEAWEVDLVGFPPGVPFFSFAPLQNRRLWWLMTKDKYPPQIIPSGMNEHQIYLSFVEKMRKEEINESQPQQLRRRVERLLKDVEKKAKEALGLSLVE